MGLWHLTDLVGSDDQKTRETHLQDVAVTMSKELGTHTSIMCMVPAPLRVIGVELFTTYKV